MSITEAALLLTAAGTVIGAVLLSVRERRKPKVDDAQAESIEADTKAIKQEIKQKSELYGAKRDLRLINMDRWGIEQIMPWARDAVTKFGMQKALALQMAGELGRDIPDISLAPIPEMPPPMVG